MTAPLHVIARHVVYHGDLTYELALWNNGRVCAEVIDAATLQPTQTASVLAGPILYDRLAHEDPETWIEEVIGAAWNAPLDLTSE
jgi:hypothetical protein